MSARDERIAADPKVKNFIVNLKQVTQEVKVARLRQRRLVARLLKEGLSTRYIARLVGVSHQTVGKMRDE